MSDKDVKIPEDLHEIVEKSIQQGLIPPQQNDRFKRCGRLLRVPFLF